MSQTIQLTASDGTILSAYQAQPSTAPRGGLVVVQEIFGVNDHIRSIVDSYAAEGYLSVAPALFDRVRVGVELGYTAEGQKIGLPIALEDLSMEQVMMDISATVDYVAQAGKIGIVGYCWGGTICYVAAARLADKIAAASGYYGGQIIPHLEERPQAPLLLHFGSEDTDIPMENIQAIAKRWPHITVHVYQGAGHGFNCNARDGFHPQHAGLAKMRTLQHFAKYLT